MIFGFNTDVKHGDTIYHVQSEAREGEFLLQTQVFVRGRCIGKKATSYAGKSDQFADTQKEQQLREQHRLVLDAIREGKLDQALDRAEPETLATVKELEVLWLNSDSVHADRNLTMQLNKVGNCLWRAAAKAAFGSYAEIGHNLFCRCKSTSRAGHAIGTMHESQI